MVDPSLRVLRTDVGGMPLEWVGFEEAVRLHCLHRPLSDGFRALHRPRRCKRKIGPAKQPCGSLDYLYSRAVPRPP